MQFKHNRNFGIAYKKIGLIYFTCLNYSSQSQRTKDKVRNLCKEIGGVHMEALFEAVTTDQTIQYVAQKYFMDESGLWRLCKKFYQSWN